MLPAPALTSCYRLLKSWRPGHLRTLPFLQACAKVELPLVDMKYGRITSCLLSFGHAVGAEPAVLWFKLFWTPVEVGFISLRGKKIGHAVVSAPDGTFTPHGFALLEIGHRIVAL